MTWWSWMVLGAILLGAELFAVDAQFYLVFIGASAALVGLAGLAGIALPDWAQWASFATLALILMFSFRQKLYAKIHGGVEDFENSLAGGSVTARTDIAPGAEARVEHHGSEWTARNVGESKISSGSSARIEKVDGLILHIRAD